MGSYNFDTLGINISHFKSDFDDVKSKVVQSKVDFYYNGVRHILAIFLFQFLGQPPFGTLNNLKISKFSKVFVENISTIKIRMFAKKIEFGTLKFG